MAVVLFHLKNVLGLALHRIQTAMTTKLLPLVPCHKLGQVV